MLNLKKNWRVKMANRRYGLAKYDAPLPIQFEKGCRAFKRGVVKNRENKRKLLVTPYHSNTMQAREWLRGFNSAFAQHLKRVKDGEIRRRSKTVYA